MRITRQNYEPFFVDFLDGKLTDEVAAELEKFLEQNPDLKDELEGYAEIILRPEEYTVFTRKEGLKKGGDAKEINEDNFEQFCIAAAEKDISPQKKRELIRFIGNDKKKEKIFNLYSKIKLIPDKIAYPQKQILYAAKTMPIYRKRFYQIMSAAASVLIIISLFFLFDYNDSYQIAETPYLQSPLPELPDPVKREMITEDPTDARSSYETVQTELPYEIQESLLTDASEKDFAYEDIQFSPHFTETTERHEMSRIKSLPPHTLASLTDAGKDIKPVRMSDGFDYTIETAASDEISIQSIAGQLTAGLLNNRNIPGIGDERINLWNIADAGIKGFTRITGREVQFEKETDEEGKVVAFFFDAGNFGISRVRGKN